MTEIKVEFAIISKFLGVIPFESGAGTITVHRDVNSMAELASQLKSITEEAQGVAGKTIRLTAVRVNNG